MPPTDAPTGYRPASKVLHWLTVLVLAAQFAVGYVMEVDDSGSGRSRGRGRGGGSGRGRGRGGESEGYLDDPETLLKVHVVLGLTVLALVATGDDDVLWLHVAAHVTFFAALLVHLGLVASRGLLPRMLPEVRPVTGV